MSKPQSIREYLAELDDSLKVRLATRERILAEAHAHLEEALASERLHGASAEQAELRAIAAFGTPQDVAASFGVQGVTALGRATVALADLFFRLQGGGWRRFMNPPMAGLMTIPVIVIALGAGHTEVVSGCAYFAGGACYWLRGILALPRPGYARRFLKLEPAVRARIVAAPNEHKPPTDPREADFAAELAMRACRLSIHPMLWLCAAYWAYWAVVALAADNNAGAAAGAAIAILCFMFGLFRRASARQQAESELAALDVVGQVISEANVRASLTAPPVIEQPQTRTRIDYLGRLCFDLRLANHGAARVSVHADRRTIWMWVDGDRFQFSGPYRLGELRLALLQWLRSAAR